MVGCLLSSTRLAALYVVKVRIKLLILFLHTWRAPIFNLMLLKQNDKLNYRYLPIFYSRKKSWDM
jgi:hypothetical protein